MKKVILKTNCGKNIELDSKALNIIKLQAKRAYKESVEFVKATKKLSNSQYLKFKKSFKGNTEFQHYTSDYVISYKTSLLSGDFKGFDFMLQFLNNNQGVPAGTIVKF